MTRAGRELGAVVCLKAKGMKEAWHLATSHTDRPGAEIVKLYSKRFTIEESFRDLKNLRFGMGLTDTRIGSPELAYDPGSSWSAPSPLRCSRCSAPPGRPSGKTAG